MIAPYLVGLGCIALGALGFIVLTVCLDLLNAGGRANIYRRTPR